MFLPQHSIESASRRYTTLGARIGIVATLVMVATSSLTGCANPFMMKDEPLELSQASDARQPSAQCQVVIVDKLGNTSKEMVNLSDSKLIGDVIREVDGLGRRPGKLEINIYRPFPDGRGTLRLPVTYEPREKRVKVEQDYQILPGDQIQIKKVESSPLDTIMKSGF